LVCYGKLLVGESSVKISAHQIVLRHALAFKLLNTTPVANASNGNDNGNVVIKIFMCTKANSISFMAATKATLYFQFMMLVAVTVTHATLCLLLIVIHSHFNNPVSDIKNFFTGQTFRY